MHVSKENLPGAIEGIRSFNFRGVNVTVPHKSAVIPYLDEIDTLAEGIGAVNTIVNENGILRGYNTDAPGFLHMLLIEGIDPSQKKITVLGAGGAAKAIAFILADKGSHLTILNRHLERAEKLADAILSTFRREVVARELNEKNLGLTLEDSEILVNTTSVGMFPHSTESLVPPGMLKPGMIVVDIIYNPRKTRLLA
ncbi:MAG: shikimate dehydrogenase, partial [Dehalococcoidales bacterium]|nr:shikimate dehydrogenase [Dehalococcoidales bacterium]